MAISKVVAGNDFTIRITVVSPQYTLDGTVFEDFDITKCHDVDVCLVCETHKVIIPLEWRIEENTNNIIIADVIGKQLHSGAVYGVQITGLDEEDKAWRYKNKAVFSVVDATKDTLIDTELIDEPLELRTEISLFVNAIPVQGPQGPQGNSGQNGLDGAQGPQGNAGQNGLDGTQGPQGNAGQNGSVSFEDLTPEQKEELKGAQGPQGNAGQNGLDGAQGPQGNAGQNGLDGAQGPKGEIGPQGPAGDGGSGTDIEPVNIVFDTYAPSNPQEGTIYITSEGDLQHQYFTLTAIDECRFKTYSGHLGNDASYSIDNGKTWTKWAGDTFTPVIKPGQSIIFANRGTGTSTGTFGRIYSTGRYAASGNINSVVWPTTTGFDWANVTDAYIARAQLSDVQQLFAGSPIVYAHELILPYTTLNNSFYSSMFSQCVALETPPALPATNLYASCYSSMFNECYSMHTAPVLPATKLKDSCYASMFGGCKNLRYIKMYGTSTQTSFDNSLYHWLNNANSLGIISIASGVTLSTGDSGVPTGWVSITNNI